jgi:hypothetical protein
MMAVRGLKSKPIFTANTTVKGARQGSVVGGTYTLVRLNIFAAETRCKTDSDFHSVRAEALDLKLSTSKILGKESDGKTNPEEMFSGGFAGTSEDISSSAHPSSSFLTTSIHSRRSLFRLGLQRRRFEA